ncbi:MAG: hypothetical protein V1845_02490 [bacterium]
MAAILFFNSREIIWTQHSLRKLRQYNLSASRIKRVLRFPKRKEVGVAENTVACMQPVGSAKHPYEIWVMYQLRLTAKQIPITKKQFPNKKEKITIISAWRYPGISPIHEPPPIPEEVWEELERQPKN